jgi:diguanylate cyclase (GGDEF)-like protein
MVGLENAPAGIVSCRTARQMVESLDFRTEYLTLIGIGIFLLGLIVTVMMIFLSQSRNMSLIYFLISIVFLSIYSLDFMSFTQLFVPYIVFKKIIIFALFACIFFLGISFSKMFESKISLVFSSALFGLITTVVILVGDMLLFKRIYDALIPLISLNFILWIVIAAMNLKEKDEAFIFLCSFVNLLIISLSDGLQLVILGGTVSTSIVTHVLVFSMILISLLYLEINRRNLAIEHETRQRSHFYQQAITDPLTGAFNLKHTMGLLTHEKPPYTIVMADVDNFKHINDRFGHPAGDYILKYLVRKMLDEFRDTDIVGRYGGDEFIIVLRGCSEKNAFDIMNRFRMHIEHDKIRFGNDTMSITLSIGIAHCDKPELTENVVKFADEALYRAKHSGKNQVSI